MKHPLPYQCVFVMVFLTALLACTFPEAPDDEGNGPNQPPVADAGADQMAAYGATVQLKGQGSDPDGHALQFSWRQIEGPRVQLSDPSAPTPTFRAPNQSALLRFLLTVSDGKATSEPDTTQVRILQNTRIDYFPLAPGNSWRYKVREVAGSIVLGVPIITSPIPITGEATLSVTRVDTLNGLLLYTVQFEEQSATDSSDVNSVNKKWQHTLTLLSAEQNIYLYDEEANALLLIFSPVNPSPQDSLFSGFSLALNNKVGKIRYVPRDTVQILFEEDPNPTCVHSGQVLPLIQINDVKLLTGFVNFYVRSFEYYSDGRYDARCKGLVAFKWFTTADIWLVAGTFHYKDYRLYESVVN